MVDLMGDVERLVAKIELELGEWSEWPGGWPAEADVAMIDAVFSTSAVSGNVRGCLRPARR
jgi:hypothetical protein